MSSIGSIERAWNSFSVMREAIWKTTGGVGAWLFAVMFFVSQYCDGSHPLLDNFTYSIGLALAGLMSLAMSCYFSIAMPQLTKDIRSKLLEHSIQHASKNEKLVSPLEIEKRERIFKSIYLPLVFMFLMFTSFGFISVLVSFFLFWEALFVGATCAVTPVPSESSIDFTAVEISLF